MAYKLAKTGVQANVQIREYICDSVDDIATLPDSDPFGSKVFVIETSETYVKSSDGEYVKTTSGGGGITPVGVINITENGDHDVTEKATARVNVPVPPGYVIPTGSVDITQNGQGIDVAGKAEVNVNVPGIVPTGNIKLNQAGQHDVSNYATATVPEFVRKEGAPNLDLLMQPGCELAHGSGFNVVFFTFYNYQQHDSDTTLMRLSTSGLNNAKAVRINDDGTWTELKSFANDYIKTDADWPVVGWNCIRLEYNNNVKQTFNSYQQGGFVIYEAYIHLPRLAKGDQYGFNANHFTVIDAAPTASDSWQSVFASRCLTYIDFHNCDTSAVTNMSSMFSNCYSLQSLDLSSFDTSAVTNMSSMFNSCYSLQSLDLSSFDTSAVTNMGSMFQYCYVLTVLSFGDKQSHQFPITGTAEKTWTANNTTNSASTLNMFYYTSSLKHIPNFVSLNKSFSITYNALTVESLLEIIDELETVLTTQTLTIDATNIAKLTADQLAVAQDKGWSVS